MKTKESATLQRKTKQERAKESEKKRCCESATAAAASSRGISFALWFSPLMSPPFFRRGEGVSLHATCAQHTPALLCLLTERGGAGDDQVEKLCGSDGSVYIPTHVQYEKREQRKNGKRKRCAVIGAHQAKRNSSRETRQRDDAEEQANTFERSATTPRRARKTCRGGEERRGGEGGGRETTSVSLGTVCPSRPCSHTPIHPLLICAYTGRERRT